MTNNEFEALKNLIGRTDLLPNERLGKYTTFKIGGPADYFIEVSKPIDLINSIAAAREIGINYTILGGGTNVMITDKGIRGLVIRNRGGEIRKIDDNLIETSSGLMNSRVLEFTLEHQLTGLEFLVGIPGTIGAAVRNNGHFRDPASFAHYFVDYRQVKDQFVNNFVEDVLIMTADGTVRRVGKDYLKPEYHRSRIKTTGDIIVTTKFRLQHSEKQVIKSSMAAQLEWRRERTLKSSPEQVIAMPLDPITGHRTVQPTLPSPGCTFSNTDNKDNHPVGRMLDLCGLKGKRVGDVMVAHEHANWIVNLGGGRADDVFKLIDICKEEVFKKFGVELTLEVDIIGER